MCMYAKISGPNYFKGGGGECKTREKFKFKFFKKEEGQNGNLSE